jgi:hypothetical protein
MDENLQELENELKRLRPRAASADLLRRLELDLGSEPGARRYTTATSLRSWKWAAWSMAGAVAVVAIVLTLNRPDHSVPAAPPESSRFVAAPTTVQPAANRYEPVAASSVLYEMKDDGVATLPDNSPGRQVRYRYVDTYTWKNPATNAALKWSVPRDEVRLVRASLD